MAYQTNKVPLSPPEQPEIARARTIRWELFYFCLVLGVIAFALELIVWPGLAGNPGYLGLLAATTFLGFLSLGIRISGLRPRLNLFYRLSLQIPLWSVTVLDLWLLVLPLFVAGPAVNDNSVNFAVDSNPVIAVATTQPQPQTQTPFLTPTFQISTASPSISIIPASSSAVFSSPVSLTKTVSQEPSTASLAQEGSGNSTATRFSVNANQPTPTVTLSLTTQLPTSPVQRVTNTPVQTVTARAVPLLLSGTFNNQGPEPVVGKVFLGETTEGQKVLRFETFNSTPGPDLFVYLSRSTNPTNRSQVMNGVEVGRLKAAKGNQNYILENSLDLSQYDSVVVYCKSFSAIFGYATLTKKV